MQAVEVEKDALHRARIVLRPSNALGAKKARLRIDSFALTANTVTYAIVGERLGYWTFFPTSPDWGIVPVWGQATVATSNHPGLRAGERLYGVLPMATHLDITVGDISEHSVTDAAEHRSAAHPFYNRYRRLPAAGNPSDYREQVREVFQPLYATGFLIERMMRTHAWFGAERMVVTSASSKTALALAHRSSVTSPGIRRIGFTSPANRDYVIGTGLYDQVLAYPDHAALSPGPAVLVDIAGDKQVRHDLHATLGQDLTYSCGVGATHAPSPFHGAPAAIPGVAPVPFFAPTQFEAAVAEVGALQFDRELSHAFDAFAAALPDFMTFTVGTGLGAAMQGYHAIRAGTVPPNTATIIRLADAAGATHSSQSGADR